MGVGLRYFFVEDDDTLRRVSIKHLEQLAVADQTCTPIPEYAGKTIRYVCVILKLDERKPDSIYRIEGYKMRFNEKGFRDEKDWLRDGRLAVETLSGTWAPYLDDYLKRLHGKSVISASHIFAKKLHEQEFRWKPENELIKKIEKLIFEKKNKPRKVTLRLVK